MSIKSSWEVNSTAAEAFKKIPNRRKYEYPDFVNYMVKKRRPQRKHLCTSYCRDDEVVIQALLQSEIGKKLYERHRAANFSLSTNFFWMAYWVDRKIALIFFTEEKAFKHYLSVHAAASKKSKIHRPKVLEQVLLKDRGLLIESFYSLVQATNTKTKSAKGIKKVNG